jgi:hypothetical protein
MEADFFNDLESALTNVGTNVLWKRKVGDVVLWIAPLTMVGQGKVVETITSADPKSNVIGETKRITLSHSVVGINETDLRPYRDGVPVFPSLDRERKPVKVSLDRYLYGKMAGWGAQFVDDAFAVYADLMESFQKQNLKDVKFENTKDPREELADLMVKVTELREQLGMNQLVDPDHEPARREELDEEVPDEPVRAAPPVGDDFDPFRQVPDRAPPSPDPVPRRAREIMESEDAALRDAAPSGAPVQHPNPNAAPAPPPMQAVGPIPVPVVSRHPGVHGPVHVGTPSVPSEVIEEPSRRTAVSPPEIDKPHSNRNPRFQPPPR